MGKIKGQIAFTLAMTLATVGAFRAECAKVYRFTGEVTAVKKNTLIVRRGAEEGEFALPKDAGKIHKGDRITVLYSMDAHQVLQSPQAAGSVPDAKTQKQHIILDDRAFFNAKNQAHPDEKNPG